VFGYRIKKLRIPHQDWFREDFLVLLELLRNGKIRGVVAERARAVRARRRRAALRATSRRRCRRATGALGRPGV
jgi:hypothetical protein